MTPIFITGTDTNCGKTYAVCQLLSYLKQKDKKALGLKPVASGCYSVNGEWLNDDEVMIQRHNPMREKVTHWKFVEPIAPHIAAAQTQQTITMTDLRAFCCTPRAAYKDLDYLLIEGAGGLMVPLNEQETWLDFLILTKMPVILVVGMRLGCINHALLTAAVMKQQGMVCVGWIANCLDPKMRVLEENIVSLEKRLCFPLLGRIPYQGDLMILKELNHDLLNGIHYELA